MPICLRKCIRHNLRRKDFPKTWHLCSFFPRDSHGLVSPSFLILDHNFNDGLIYEWVKSCVLNADDRLNVSDQLVWGGLEVLDPGTSDRVTISLSDFSEPTSNSGNTIQWQFDDFSVWADWRRNMIVYTNLRPTRWSRMNYILGVILPFGPIFSGPTFTIGRGLAMRDTYEYILSYTLISLNSIS